MINDIFKLFGEQTADILFEIITECMDDYLYIFDLQNNIFEISQSAVERFNMSKNVLTDAANEVMKVVYEEDRRMLAKHLADICEGRENVHNLHYRWLDKEGMKINERTILNKGCRICDQEMVEGIFDLILETVLSKNGEITISGDVYLKNLVKSKFLKLNYSHVEYVINCLGKNTTKVRNIKSYLLASLFNAGSTISSYYRAEVNHDMPQYAG